MPLIIYLDFIIVIIAVHYSVDRDLFVHLLLFVFLFLPIPPIPPLIKPVESCKVVIITVIPTRPQVLALLDLECQLPRYALNVDVLAIAGADELLSDYDL